LILEIAYKKHKDWLRICKSFDCSNDDCQDIVSEMYLKIDDLTKKGKDLRYGDNDINYWYLYKMIFHACLRTKQMNNRRSDVIFSASLNSPSNHTNNDMQSDLGCTVSIHNITANINDNILQNKLQDFTAHYESKLVWYDIAIFELITDGKKISQLSRETNISYKSLRNTYLKVKEFIKQEYEKYDWIRGHSGKDN